MFITFTIEATNRRKPIMKATKKKKRKVYPKVSWRKAINKKRRSFLQRVGILRNEIRRGGYKIGRQICMFTNPKSN